MHLHNQNACIRRYILPQRGVQTEAAFSNVYWERFGQGGWTKKTEKLRDEIWDSLWTRFWGWNVDGTHPRIPSTEIEKQTEVEIPVPDTSKVPVWHESPLQGIKPQASERPPATWDWRTTCKICRILLYFLSFEDFASSKQWRRIQRYSQRKQKKLKL